MSISFIGGGNMAEALVRGALAAGTEAADVRVSDPNPARRAELEERYGVATAADNSGDAELVVLAVKPWIVPEALASVHDELGDSLLVSVAAGVTLRQLEGAVPDQTRVIRAMPNTPAMVLAGATAIAAGSRASDVDMQRAESLFAAVGSVAVVSEPLLDAVTGLSGSGPAYAMLFIEALADGGVRAGLSREIALQLAAQTLAGAAKMQLESGLHPAILRDRVTSPAGTTAAGLAALERGAARSAIAEAVVAAAARASELGKGA